MSNPYQTAGRGHEKDASSRTSRRPGRGRGRNVAVGPLVRMAIGGLVDNFRQLPGWAQRDAATTLMNLFPDAFSTRARDSYSLSQATRDGYSPTRTGSNNAQRQQPVSSGTRVDVSTTSTSETGPADGGASGQASTQKSGKKLKGFRREEVRELEFAIRLGSPPEGYTIEQRAADSKLLSCALAAVSRGEAAGKDKTAIVQGLAEVRASQESYERLWPSIRVRKRYALKRPNTGNTPKVVSVDDEYLVHTLHSPIVVDGDTVMEDADDAKSNLIPLNRISFHRPQQVAKRLTAETIQDFISGRSGNYEALKQKVRLLHGRVALYWLKGFAISTLRWGDTEDDSVDLEPVQAKSPSRKKKRRRTEE